MFIIETSEVEYRIIAVNLQDALETFDGDPNDIICIKEYYD